jgi:hypothetical protein
MRIERIIEDRAPLQRRGIIWADPSQPSADQIDTLSRRLEFKLLHGIHLIYNAGNPV